MTGEKEILFAPGTRLRIDKVTHLERDVVSVEATIVKASE